MKKVILTTLCAVFMASLIGCGNKTEAPKPAEDSIVSEEPAAPTIDTLALIDQRAKELGKKYLIIKQPQKGRIIYAKHGLVDDCTVKLHVEDVINKKKETVKVDVNDYVDDIQEGRDENEIYIFSTGGSGSYGMIGHVELDPIRTLKDFESLDLPGFSFKKKTDRGFLVRIGFKDFDENENMFFTSCELEISWDGKILWQGKNKVEYE